MVRSKYSRKKILAEIRKCDCLCANCHRKEHFNAGDCTIPDESRQRLGV